MAKIPIYTQEKLKSSLIDVPPVDTSGGQIMDSIANGAGQVASAALYYGAEQIQQQRLEAAKKEAEVKAIEQKKQNVENEIQAYNISIKTESSLNQLIDQAKTDYSNDPAKGLQYIQDEGGKLIAETLGGLSENVGLKEKTSGILMNSFRGKLSELHTWSVTQGATNAKSQMSESYDMLVQQAGRAKNIGEIQKLLSKVDTSKDNAYMAYGAKSSEIMNNAKTNIAKSYIVGMLDRGQPEQVAATLDSKAFDSMIDTDTRVSLKKAATTMIKAKDEADKYDKLLQIVSIRQGVAVAQANGTYTPSMGMQATQKLIELEGGKGDYSVITNATTKYIEDSQKKITEADKRATLSSLYGSWYKITGGDDTINKSATLEDVVRFQKEVEKARPYLSPQEYEKFSAKLTKSKTKRLSNMGRGWFGIPKGEMADKDEFSGGYQYIYDWTHKHIKDEGQRSDILDYMVTTYIKAVDQVEKKQGGKAITSTQKWNLLKEIQHRAAQKINPYLSNLPPNGQRMADDEGNQFIYYPDGSIERV